MQYTAQIQWHRNDAEFTTKSFDRTHDIELGSGNAIKASSAPEFLGNPTLANPEELFIASVSSCFMLTFLYWSAMKGLKIDEYQAEAIGILAKNSEGKMAVTEITLQPKIIFTENNNPDSVLLDELFKKAHDNCFISSSIKTVVKILK